MDAGFKSLGKKHLLLFYLLLWATDLILDAFFLDHATNRLVFGPASIAHETFMRIEVILAFTMAWLLFKLHFEKSMQYEVVETVFENSAPICVTDMDFNILKANRSYWEIFGKPAPELTGKPLKCFEHRPGDNCLSEKCPVNRIKANQGEIFYCETMKQMKDRTLHFTITIMPIFNKSGKLIAISETFLDITQRKELENQKEVLINNLNKSLEEVKMLSGLLPICAGCKKIRDDGGYWNQIENYLQTHTRATFSHSLCPDCAENLYSEFK